MYELITQKPPFIGRDYMELFYQHEHKDPVKPSEIVNISPALESIIIKCLSKRPQDRYLTYKELSSDLQLLLEEKSTQRFSHLDTYDQHSSAGIKPLLIGMVICLITSITCELLLAHELGLL